MTTEERKTKVAELRKHHEPTFKALNIPNAYFVSKYPHIPEGDTTKCIGLYPSECSGGDDIYIECCDMNYTPLDNRRMLYVWKHNPNYEKDYSIKKGQFMIPVSELHVVKEVCAPEIMNKLGSYTQIGHMDTLWKEIDYRGADNTRIRLTTKNGFPELFEYFERYEDESALFSMTGAALTNISTFFKTLK